MQNDTDFQTRMKKFEKNKDYKEKKDGSLNQEHVSTFLKETSSLCENYEKEIELLRHKLEEKKMFNNLEISPGLDTDNESYFEILSNPKDVFMKGMGKITSGNPDFGEITTIYNEKIAELFDENEKLQVTLKNMKNMEKENANYEKKIKSLNDIIIDKEKSIANINGMFNI